jgi:hypothetical protein
MCIDGADSTIKLFPYQVCWLFISLKFEYRLSLHVLCSLVLQVFCLDHASKRGMFDAECWVCNNLFSVLLFMSYRKLGLDLVVRDDRGNIIDPMRTSTINLYRLVRSSQ